MKRTIKLLALAAVVAVFAVPALAQTKECNDEFKSATYSKWYDNRQKDQPAAYEAAKEYLAVCTTDDQYTAALKKFKAAYEAATADVTNRTQFNEAVQKKNYADQMRLGKAVLATDADNPAVNIVLGLTGLGDPNLLSESAPYARKAIELIEGGKPFSPLPSKDAALAFLNYVVAKSVVKGDPAAAIPYFLKAAKYESDLKKNPQLYLDLAGAYNDGPQAKLTEEYNAKVGPDKTETEASKLVLANLNPVIDRQIDALARAAALADAANKQAVMDELTKLYEYRNKTKTGVNELVASVLSKPLPDVPTPITSLPTPSAPATPANSGSQSGSNPGTTSTAGSGNGTGTATGTTSGKATGSAKPTASPTPGKKPRTNYRRG
jgi:hypothetical protein